jgi:hypothetical protein
MQEDLQICTSQIIINGSTTLQLHHKLPSSFCCIEIQENEGVATMTLG